MSKYTPKVLNRINSEETKEYFKKLMRKECLKHFYKLGNGDVDQICAQLQMQILREGSTDFLKIFREREETDLMKLALFIKERNQ